MAIRREQLVLLLAVAVLGWLLYGNLGSGTPAPRGGRSGSSVEFVSIAIPDVSLALREEGRKVNFERDLFAPPRDTAPLPLLALDAPPTELLPGLAPPAARGPATRLMGRFLRRDATPTFVPDLFVVEEEGGALGFDDSGPGDTGLGADEVALTAEERAERMAGYKRLYDWIRLGNVVFGQIRNADRYDLARRINEPIEFTEIDPATGRERYSGMEPIDYARDRVQEFAFADTPTNRIEFVRREFGDSLRSSQLESALAFADECVAVRLEAPRALEIAEEMYRMADTVAEGDPRPKLGLAQCLEAGFQFNDAFGLYRGLRDGAGAKDPLVHARLGDLLARFRMFGFAEAAYEEALRWGRTDWQARWHYGRFLLDQGRGDEALEHLDQANKFEPKSPETKNARASMRADYGWALLFVGRMDEARDWFGRALNVDPEHQSALAGKWSADRFLAGTTNGDGGGVRESGDTTDGATLPAAGFDLLLALGLSALHHGEWQEAERALTEAASLDPFRAFLAWRALSWLAEVTGYPDEAASFIDRAHENNPTDAYTLYQRGRILALRDDLEGARESFKAALDQELDFSDALLGMAVLEALEGDHFAAERYFERALAIDPERPIAHSMRGFNAFELGDEEAADASFDEALRRDSDLPSARIGRAWARYLARESAEAITQFSDLAENRRNEPEDDAFKVFANAQIERIQAHEEKELWSDRFDRRPGRPANGWQLQEGHGLEIALRDGAVVIDGQFSSSGETRFFQELPGGRFVSAEMAVTVHAGTRADVGVFLAREIRRGGEWQVQSQISVFRNKEGAVEMGLIQQGESEAQREDLYTTRWDVGQPMRLSIEVAGEASDTVVTLYVDGLLVYGPKRMSALGRTTSPLRFGVFVRGDSGRSAAVTVDNVEVVRRIR